MQDLKKYLSSTPILVAPKPQEPLLLYLAATNQIVSTALLAQREVDQEAAATAESTYGEPEPSPSGLGPGKTESPARADASATGPARLGEVV